MFLVKMSQAKPPLIASSPPPLGQTAGLEADFHVVKQNPPRKCAMATRHFEGENGVISGLISFDNGSIVLGPIQHEGGQ